MIYAGDSNRHEFTLVSTSIIWILYEKKNGKDFITISYLDVNEAKHSDFFFFLILFIYLFGTVMVIFILLQQLNNQTVIKETFGE